MTFKAYMELFQEYLSDKKVFGASAILLAAGCKFVYDISQKASEERQARNKFADQLSHVCGDQATLDIVKDLPYDEVLKKSAVLERNYPDL